MRWFFLAIAVPISGCVLSAEDCGLNFELEAGRCVPVTAADPYRDDRDGGTPTRDGAVERDAEPDEPGNPWSRYTTLRIDDVTLLADLRAVPDAPGVDVDAVEVMADDLYGWAIAADGNIADPDDLNRYLDPGAALGPPDGLFVSLGGGDLNLTLELTRPLRSGDRFVVWVEQVGSFELYQLSVCTPDLLCDPLGRGEGTSEFELP